MEGYSNDGSSQGRSYPGTLRFPTQYELIPATGYAPRPVAMTSRNLPPVPVSAPGNGATPEGKLWVSAVSIGWRVRFAISTGPALPLTVGVGDGTFS